MFPNHWILIWWRCLKDNRKSYTREGFIEMLKYYPLAMPKIYVSLFWNCKCYYEEPYAGKPHVRFCEGITLWGVSLLDCKEQIIWILTWGIWGYLITVISCYKNLGKPLKTLKFSWVSSPSHLVSCYIVLPLFTNPHKGKNKGKKVW